MAYKVGDKVTAAQNKHGYHLSLIINDMEYEPDVDSVRIINSFNGAYPVFIIKMNLSPLQVINEKILGQNNIELTINYINADNNALFDDFCITLIYLSGEYDYPISNQLLSNDSAMEDVVPYTMRAVPEPAFRLMTKTLNSVYKNATPFQILGGLFVDALDTSISCESGFDDINADNDTIIEQVMFPPTILKNHFDYLLNEIGLYKGFGVIYAMVSNGYFEMELKAMDLVVSLGVKHPAFTVTQLANDASKEETENITNNIEKGNMNDFYTHNLVHTNYIANTTMANIGRHITYIHKPVDRLSLKNSYNSDTYMGDGFQESDLYDEPYRTDSLNERTRYITNHICHERRGKTDHDENDDESFLDQYYMKNNIQRKMANLSQVKLKIHGIMPLHKFTNIGEAVDFSSMTAEYEPLQGRYIFFASDLVFTRKSEWILDTDITLIRPTWEAIYK